MLDEQEGMMEEHLGSDISHYCPHALLLYFSVALRFALRAQRFFIPIAAQVQSAGRIAHQFPTFLAGSCDSMLFTAIRLYHETDNSLFFFTPFHGSL
jgi:hypothetical protein